MFSFNTKRGGGGERADYLVWEPDRGHRVHFIYVYFKVRLYVCGSVFLLGMYVSLSNKRHCIFGQCTENYCRIRQGVRNRREIQLRGPPYHMIIHALQTGTSFK